MNSVRSKLLQGVSRLPEVRACRKETHQWGLESIDLLKMNIHGNEYEVLLSTPHEALRQVQRIAVQYHELPEKLNLGKAQLFSYLGESGFELGLDIDTHRGAGIAVFLRR
jgi:hypothetical protein